LTLLGGKTDSEEPPARRKIFRAALPEEEAKNDRVSGEEKRKSAVER